MPEWITPLFRVLVAMPSFGFCSTRNTSSHRCETACAIAQPITPPPIIRMFAWSIKKRLFLYFITSLLLFRAPNLIEIRLALHKLRLAAIMHRILRALARFISVAPQRSASVNAILVERVEIDVKCSQFLLVVFVVARDSRQRLQARVGRRFPLPHHLDDGVPARNLDIFLALAGRARRAHLIVRATPGTNNRRVSHAPWNFPRQTGSRGGRGNVSLFVDRHARNRARGGIGNHPLRVREKRLIFRRVLKNRGHLFLPFRAVNSRPPVERAGSFPRQPDLA